MRNTIALFVVFVGFASSTSVFARGLKLELSAPQSSAIEGVVSDGGQQPDATRALDCNLVQGALAGSHMLVNRPSISGDVYVFRAALSMKYSEGSTFSDDLVRLARTARSADLARSLNRESITIRSHLTDLYGDVNAFRQKLAELDTVYVTTHELLKSWAQDLCAE